MRLAVDGKKFGISLLTLGFSILGSPSIPETHKVNGFGTACYPRTSWTSPEVPPPSARTAIYAWRGPLASNRKRLALDPRIKKV